MERKSEDRRRFTHTKFAKTLRKSIQPELASKHFILSILTTLAGAEIAPADPSSLWGPSSSLIFTQDALLLAEALLAFHGWLAASAAAAAAAALDSIACCCYTASGW